MAEDVDGNIWIIREMQLQCYHPKKDQLIQHGSRNMVGELEPTESLPVVDAEGQVWLGAIGNVVTFNPCQMRALSAPTLYLLVYATKAKARWNPCFTGRN